MLLTAAGHFSCPPPGRGLEVKLAKVSAKFYSVLAVSRFYTSR